MNKDLKSLMDRIVNLEGKLTPLEMPIMENLENRLNIKLSDEFKTLNSMHRYDYFGLFGFYAWNTPQKFSVLNKTIGYREKLNLPHEFLVFAEDDVTCVFMQTNKDPEKPSPVIFCPIEEVDNLCATNTIPANAEVFKTFTDFYEYLLEEEEKQQQENAKNP